jgi:hypothetical protein
LHVKEPRLSLNGGHPLLIVKHTAVISGNDVGVVLPYANGPSDVAAI